MKISLKLEYRELSSRISCFNYIIS